MNCGECIYGVTLRYERGSSAICGYLEMEGHMRGRDAKNCAKFTPITEESVAPVEQMYGCRMQPKAWRYF